MDQQGKTWKGLRKLMTGGLDSHTREGKAVKPLYQLVQVSSGNVIWSLHCAPKR